MLSSSIAHTQKFTETSIDKRRLPLDLLYEQSVPVACIRNVKMGHRFPLETDSKASAVLLSSDERGGAPKRSSQPMLTRQRSILNRIGCSLPLTLQRMMQPADDHVRRMEHSWIRPQRLLGLLQFSKWVRIFSTSCGGAPSSGSVSSHCISFPHIRMWSFSS